MDKRIFCNPSGCSSTRDGKRTRNPRTQRYHMFNNKKPKRNGDPDAAAAAAAAALNDVTDDGTFSAQASAVELMPLLYKLFSAATTTNKDMMTSLGEHDDAVSSVDARDVRRMLGMLRGSASSSHAVTSRSNHPVTSERERHTLKQWLNSVGAKKDYQKVRCMLIISL